LALELTENAVILERGRIVHRAQSRELLSDPALLERYIGLKLAEAGR
jgi:branched-chain amino acid transport system ATP-binding protein